MIGCGGAHRPDVPLEIPMVAIVQFEGEKVPHEHNYWGQASVLVQVGPRDPHG
jgi:carboxymethylenebutenolidase